jgi:microcystin-dependent protein
MDEPFIGEIRPISFNYAPKGWAFCNGQLLPINSNQALFSLLGVTFGGDGRTTFALPDLRSRVPVGTGQGPGLANYLQGQQAGTESVTLTADQMPAHTHPVTGTMQTAEIGEANSPKNSFLTGDANAQYGTPANATMGATVKGTTTNIGSGQAHENRQPVLGLNYVIALSGLYPSRA